MRARERRRDPVLRPFRVSDLPSVFWLNAGAITYSFYLWHQNVIDQVNRQLNGVPLLAVSLLVTTAIASLSWFLLERPALNRMPTWLLSLKVRDHLAWFRSQWKLTNGQCPVCQAILSDDSTEEFCSAACGEIGRANSSAW